MKRIIRRVQRLGRQANELREAMSKLPPKVAEFRQAVTMTKDQWQALRQDVQAAVTDLTADSEDRLTGALHEINGSREVLQQAGYELSGVDLDLSQARRLKMHLTKCQNVRAADLRRLAKKNEGLKVTHALLQSLIQADAMAEKVVLENLDYHGVEVEIGAVPRVVLCWRAEEIYEEEIDEAPRRDDAAASDPPPLPRTQASSAFGQSSFFAPREPSPSAVPEMESGEPKAEAASHAGPGMSNSASSYRRSRRSFEMDELGKDWRKEALERLKRNPSVSKYRR